MNKELNIAIACDNNYLIPFYVLITSIFFNNRGSIIKLHVIITGVDENEKESISRFVQKNGGEISYYSIDEEYITGLYLPPQPGFSHAIYYRILFPLLVPKDVATLLYLDTDIVVNGSLLDLFNIDLTGFPVAAVVDNDVPVRIDLGINEAGGYFNSGVLLIDVNDWLEQKVSQRSFEFIENNADKIPYGDQCALNAVLVNNWLKLPLTFNLMFCDIPRLATRRQLLEFLDDKIIIHFTTKNKPWKYDCINRGRFLYHKYLLLSPNSISHKKYVDFKLSFHYIKRFIMIRLNELYYDHPYLHGVWKKMKRKY